MKRSTHTEGNTVKPRAQQGFSGEPERSIALPEFQIWTAQNGERIKSELELDPLPSFLIAHNVQQKIRMAPAVSGRNGVTYFQLGLVPALVPTGETGDRILRVSGANLRIV